MSRENVEIVRNLLDAFARRWLSAWSEPPYALVFTLRDGKVVRWKNYLDQTAALEAVGLSRR